MTGVLVMTSQLNDTDSRADHRMLAETVLVSGDGLANILNDILDVAKIESGHLDSESIAFDLRSLVEDVVNLISVPAHDRGLDLECRFPADMPLTFRGDPGRLRRVVTNLVDNALKFTPAGAVLLELIVEDGHEETVMVRFEVVGVRFGITRAHQPAFFESFSQVDADTIRSYGAAGLGLAMSHQLIELMGGQIGVHNELGLGSTFWFSVPLHKVRSVAMDEESGGTTASGGPDVRPSSSGPGAPGQILLAEDNPVNQRVAAAMLENLGFRVDVVADGAQAVQAAAAAPYKAIFMDGQMPVLDGYEATSEIRRLQAGSHRTPIIAVTGSTMKSDQLRCLAAGMDDFIAKPMNLHALDDVLTRWASDGSDPAALGDPSAPPPRSWSAWTIWMTRPDRYSIPRLSTAWNGWAWLRARISWGNWLRCSSPMPRLGLLRCARPWRAVMPPQ